MSTNTLVLSRNNKATLKFVSKNLLSFVAFTCKCSYNLQRQYGMFQLLRPQYYVNQVRVVHIPHPSILLHVPFLKPFPVPCRPLLYVHLMHQLRHCLRGSCTNVELELRRNRRKSGQLLHHTRTKWESQANIVNDKKVM